MKKVMLTATLIKLKSITDLQHLKIINLVLALNKNSKIRIKILYNLLIRKKKMSIKSTKNYKKN